MAEPLRIAISDKALKLLQDDGSEIGKLIAGGKVVDGMVEITIDAEIDAKLQTAKGERGGKHNALADRLIAKVAEAKQAEVKPEADASEVKG